MRMRPGQQKTPNQSRFVKDFLEKRPYALRGGFVVEKQIKNKRNTCIGHGSMSKCVDQIKRGTIIKQVIFIKFTGGHMKLHENTNIFFCCLDTRCKQIRSVTGYL